MNNEEFVKTCLKVRALSQHANNFMKLLPKQEFNKLFEENKEQLTSYMPELANPNFQHALWSNMLILFSLEDGYKNYLRKKGSNQNSWETIDRQAL